MASILVGVAATGSSGLIGTAGVVTASGVATAVGTGLAVGGAIQQGQAAKAQAKSAENMANYKAAADMIEAKAQRQKARFEQKRQAERASRIKGGLTAQIAAVGGLGSPVAEDLAAEQAAESELENLLIGYEGRVAANRAEAQADIDRLGGKIAKRKGKSQKMASYYQAGTSLLAGFANSPLFAGKSDSPLFTGKQKDKKIIKKTGPELGRIY